MRPAPRAVVAGPRLIWKSRLSQLTEPLPKGGALPVGAEQLLEHTLQPPSSSLGTITVRVPTAVRVIDVVFGQSQNPETVALTVMLPECCGSETSHAPSASCSISAPVPWSSILTDPSTSTSVPQPAPV